MGTRSVYDIKVSQERSESSYKLPWGTLLSYANLTCSLTALCSSLWLAGRSSDVIEASLTDTERRVSLTPIGSSSSAGRRGKGIGQGNVTRTRNMCYILILAGGGGLASQSPLKGSPALECVHYPDLQEGGEKCSFRDEDTVYKTTTGSWRTSQHFLVKLALRLRWFQSGPPRCSSHDKHGDTSKSYWVGDWLALLNHNDQKSIIIKSHDRL